MKKYIVFSLVFGFALFAFNTITSAAVDADGCGAGPFSSTTGKPCSAASVPGCEPGYKFSPLSGRPCSAATSTGTVTPTGTGGSAESSSAPVEAAGLTNQLFNRELGVGTKGEDVRALQQFLKDSGFLSGTVDGSFGPITRGAVTKYQTQTGIVPTGKADTNTLRGVKLMPWYRLCPIINKLYGVSYPCPTAPPLPVPEPCPLFANTNGSIRHDCPPETTRSLTVLSPNGGEAFAKGTTQIIKWQDNTSSTCPTGKYCAQFLPAFKYDIFLHEYYPPCTSNTCPLYPYQAPRTLATKVSGSSLEWLIPNCTATAPCSSNFEIPSGSYTMQVCQTGTSICDSSDSYFKITTDQVSLIRACPEKWVDNQMPLSISPGDGKIYPREYYIYKGIRRELAEFDTAWVKKNCSVKPEIVY